MHPFSLPDNSMKRPAASLRAAVSSPAGTDAQRAHSTNAISLKGAVGGPACPANDIGAPTERRPGIQPQGPARLELIFSAVDDNVALHELTRILKRIAAENDR